MEIAQKREKGATVFGYWVKDPQNYGVAEFDTNDKVVGVEEKPDQPKSHYAITGLYFYDNQVVHIANSIQPSARGELEITDVNRVYLQQSQLSVERMSRGFAWLDTGTHESLLEANQFVASLQERQGFKISCPEEIAWRMGYVTSEELESIGKKMGKNEYSRYLLGLIKK